MKDEQCMQESLVRRLAELVQRDLPEGWSCQIDGDGLILLAGEKQYRITLNSLFEQVRQNREDRRNALYDHASRILAMIKMSGQRTIVGQAKRLYPVLRHRSFLDSARGAEGIVNRPHTAETIILYACDQLEGYFLITREMLAEATIDEKKLHQLAMTNLEGLEASSRMQQLGENRITFINSTDGYAASRVLLTHVLERYQEMKQGRQLGVAIPHQDVLVLADIADDQGAQLFARLTYDFASKGDVPICPIPFFYERGELEPFIIITK
jgi:uncharacterized protein YtpQ (UPF0354 family)